MQRDLSGRLAAATTHNRTLSRPSRFLQSGRSFTETQPRRIRGPAGDL